MTILNTTIEAMVTADQIITVEVIRALGTIIDGKACFASIPKVRAAALASGVEDFDQTIVDLWQDGVVVPHWGNPGKVEDKSTLLYNGDDVYCSVSEQ